MKKAYNPKKIEAKWQKEWAESGVYLQYGRKKKFYVLDMFPYPSGAGLHVGHPKGCIATDVLARMKQLQGYGVLHPMGWDAFGLPAEQFALKNKVHPEKAVKENIKTFKKKWGKTAFPMIGNGKSIPLIRSITNGRSGFFYKCGKKDWHMNHTTPSTGAPSV